MNDLPTKRLTRNTRPFPHNAGHGLITRHESIKTEDAAIAATRSRVQQMRSTSIHNDWPAVLPLDVIVAKEELVGLVSDTLSHCI